MKQFELLVDQESVFFYDQNFLLGFLLFASPDDNGDDDDDDD